eukprot:12413768-Karenia_brevis.AAC.1
MVFPLESHSCGGILWFKLASKYKYHRSLAISFGCGSSSSSISSDHLVSSSQLSIRWWVFGWMWHVQLQSCIFPAARSAVIGWAPGGQPEACTVLGRAEWFLDGSLVSSQ